jgi:hypothetical protein
MAVCSFFKFLFYRYPESFLLNPFHDRKLPKLVKVRKTDFPTTTDIQILKKEFRRIGRKDLICVINVIEKHGFRVGIFEHMELGETRNMVSISKGKTIKEKLTKRETTEILNSGIIGTKPTTISNVIKKYTKKLFDNQEISCSFSVHDLRRYYIDEKAKTSTAKEFLVFSRGIHKSPMTTFGYLSS